MQVIKEDYGETDEDEDEDGEYGIVYTQDSVVVDYKKISNITTHLFKQDHEMIQDSLLLLNDCSTIDIICNLHLVTNIHEMDQRCIITTNADTGSTNLRAILKSNILPLKKEVRFDSNSIANIIALYSFQDQFKVSYSNWFGNKHKAFVVIKPDNTKMKLTM